MKIKPSAWILILSIPMSSVFGVVAIYLINDIVQISNETPRTIEEELLLADQIIAKAKNGDLTAEDTIRVMEGFKLYRRPDNKVRNSIQNLFVYAIFVFVCMLLLQLWLLFWYLKKENDRKISP